MPKPMTRRQENWLRVRRYAAALRARPTRAERAVCALLDDAGIRYDFQWPFVRSAYCYIADFRIPCSPHGEYVILELDGPEHRSRRSYEYDARRTERLRRSSACIAVFRFTDHDVFTDSRRLMLTVLAMSDLAQAS